MPFTVSVDFQLSPPELAADPWRSAASRLVIVVISPDSVDAPMPLEPVNGPGRMRGGDCSAVTSRSRVHRGQDRGHGACGGHQLGGVVGAGG
jgi:hypothetical protein